MHSATRSSKASNFALCWRRMVPIMTMLLIKFNFLYRCCKAPGQELSQVHLGNTCPPPVPNSHSRNISRRGRGDPCTHPPPPPEPAPGGRGTSQQNQEDHGSDSSEPQATFHSPSQSSPTAMQKDCGSTQGALIDSRYTRVAWGSRRGDKVACKAQRRRSKAGLDKYGQSDDFTVPMKNQIQAMKNRPKDMATSAA